MTQEVSAYISGIASLATLIGYILLYKYQKQKIDLLQKSLDSQSKIISDFERYKNLFDISDFEKRLEVKLDTEKMILTKTLNENADKRINQAIDSFAKHVTQSIQEGMKGWEELINIVVNMTLKKYPKKEHKPERDKHIIDWYPNNANFLIHFLDNIIDGKVEQQKPI